MISPAALSAFSAASGITPGGREAAPVDRRPAVPGIGAARPSLRQDATDDARPDQPGRALPRGSLLNRLA